MPQKLRYLGTMFAFETGAKAPKIDDGGNAPLVLRGTAFFSYWNKGPRAHYTPLEIANHD